METQLSISEANLSYSVMSEADELDLGADDQDLLTISTITRLSTSDGTEATDEATARTDQLKVIRKAMNLRNRLVKMHKCNRIVYTKIMAY